jgi:hypothetical protein
MVSRSWVVFLVIRCGRVSRVVIRIVAELFRRIIVPEKVPLKGCMALRKPMPRQVSKAFILILC